MQTAYRCGRTLKRRRLGDEARSLAYYQDAHRVWPVNLDVISWLGAYHVRTGERQLCAPLPEQWVHRCR